MSLNVSFKNRSGLNLSGVLHVPDTGEVHAYALFAHCFTCTKNIMAAVNIAQAMADNGIAVLRFDFTGLGASEGEFSNTHFSSNLDDLEDAASFLTSQYHAPSLLVGHSLGGTAALAVANRLSSIKAVVTIGSPADADHVLHLFQNDVDEIEKTGKALVKLAGRPFNIKKEFIEDAREQSVKENLRTMRKALLIMHSPVDELVSVEQASTLFSHAMHPKSYISLDGADHLLSQSKDSVYVGSLLTQWALKYLPSPIKTFSYPKIDKKRVIAHLNSDDAFLTTMNVQGHHMLADEPISFGGKELGPTPYGYLSSGLAACTVMTINMFASRNNWPLKSVAVNVSHNKIHAKECENCESKDGKVDHFHRELTITGELSEEQKQTLLKIADRCPVHKSLHQEVRVTTDYKTP